MVIIEEGDVNIINLIHFLVSNVITDDGALTVSSSEK